jgi:purine-binding chemotaxis protein CheW
VAKTGSNIVKGSASMPVATPTPVPEDKRAPEAVHEFLGFGLASEAYALPLSNIREILKPPPITQVPRAPFDVPGIVSVRGAIITVVDLRVRLKLPLAPHGKHSRILLVSSGEETVGLLVDHVLQVFRLRDEEIEYAVTAGGDMAEYVMGIGRPRSGRAAGRAREVSSGMDREDDILILLDPVSLLRR